jgi:hypothetical protein
MRLVREIDSGRFILSIFVPLKNAPGFICPQNYIYFPSGQNQLISK